MCGRKAEARLQGTSDEQARQQGPAPRRAVHARLRAVQLPDPRAVQRVRHAVRRAGALRLHLHRLGGADRADGAAWPSRGTSASAEAAACCRATVIILIVVRLPGPAVRDRLLRRQARRCRPLDHRQPVHLQPVARGLRDGVDVLRQRRPRGERRRRLPADLHRADADDRAVVGGDAQDPAHQQGRTASPRSPTSSPRATARARCSAGSSPSSR